MANALAALDKTNALVDDRIREVIAKLRTPKQPDTQDEPRRAGIVLDDLEEQRREMRRNLDRMGITNQPDMED